MKTANGTFQCRATQKNSLLMRFCFRDTQNESCQWIISEQGHAAEMSLLMRFC